jgi:hypothetical protein
MAQRSVELHGLDAGTSKDVAQQQHAQSNGSEPQSPSAESSLPPVDRGKEAWLLLAACWVVEALTFGEYLPARSQTSSRLTWEQPGFGSSFGVFQDFYSNNEPFAGSSSIAAIGTTTTVRKP